MRRSRIISVQTKMPKWSFGLLVGAVAWIIGAQFVGSTNPWLLGGCILLSALLDSPSEGVYID